MTVGTELSVIERAQLALNSPEYEKQLRELVEGSKDLVAVTNPASYDEIHSAHMRLVRVNVEIEKKGKASREDARAYAQAVITEEKRLLAISNPEKERLSAIKDEYNTRREREQKAKAEAEAARLSRIQGAIADLANGPGTLVGQPSVMIAKQLAEVRSHDVRAWCEEFGPQAQEAKSKAIASLELMLAGTLAQEQAAKAAADKLAADMAELARLKAEQQERDQVAAEAARQQAEEQARRQAEIDAAERASREKIEAEQAAAQKLREEEDRKAAEDRARLRAIETEEYAKAAAARAAAQKEADEKAWAERNARDVQDRAERAKREAEAEKVRQQQAEVARAQAEAQAKLEAEKRELARQQEELLATDRLIIVLRARFGSLPRYAQLAAALDQYIGQYIGAQGTPPASKSQAKRVAQRGAA